MLAPKRSVALQLGTGFCVAHCELYNFGWWKAMSVFFARVGSVLYVSIVFVVHATSLSVVAYSQI